MRHHRAFDASPVWVTLFLVACDSQPPSSDDVLEQSPPQTQPRPPVEGGGGAAVENPKLPEPRYHPAPGFENCKHVEVKADCDNGWCKLPPSCFVVGSPEDEWFRARYGEEQIAVTLTNVIEIQQEEMSRKQWEEITGTPAPGPDNCNDPECPVAMVSWWDAVHAANMLSEKKSLAPCYEPVGCTGSIGKKDLQCTGVAEPDKSVYECEGYRLPTSTEAEYAARAGTISTFYSGDITPSPEGEYSLSCHRDPALDEIAWYCHNSGDRPHVGGKLKPNDFGLYDVLGNLSEWVNDHQRSAPVLESVDPQGTVGTHFQRRRFSPQYGSSSAILRPAARFSGPWDGSGPGFRLVRTLTPNSPPDGTGGASNK